MPFFKVTYQAPASPSLSGFNEVTDTASGIKVADLLDTTGASTGYALNHPQAFINPIGSAGDATSSPDPDFPVGFFQSSFYIDVGGDIEITGLPEGATCTLKVAGNNGNSRDTQYAVTNGGPAQTYVDDGALDPVESPVGFTATVPVGGTIVITLTELNTFAYINGFSMDVQVGATPTISNVDGDNAVNQGQLVNIDTTNFTEVIATGDIGGTAFPSIPDNDPTDDVIQVRIPVTLTDGTYDVTISGATETDTISGVTYTVTHPYEAPYGQVDSNSDWDGQKLTPDTYWRVVTPFAHGTYDFVAGAAETPPFGNDINDHFTPEAGYEGSDSEIREVMYADGTTAQYTVNIEISDGTAEVDWPFSKQIRYAATKNWTWGARHPMTGMRVRIFK